MQTEAVEISQSCDCTRVYSQFSVQFKGPSRDPRFRVLESCFSRLRATNMPFQEKTMRRDGNLQSHPSPTLHPRLISHQPPTTKPQSPNPNHQSPITNPNHESKHLNSIPCRPDRAVFRCLFLFPFLFPWNVDSLRGRFASSIPH